MPGRDGELTTGWARVRSVSIVSSMILLAP